jgi:hypothetical protein
MFAGAIKKGTSLTGYAENGLFEPASLEDRHEALETEGRRRGYNMASPLQEVDVSGLYGRVPRIESLRELLSRCKECGSRYKAELGCHVTSIPVSAEEKKRS